MKKRTFTMVCKQLDLAKSKALYKFDTFNPKDWTIVKGTPKWKVSAKKIRGGGADEPTHGQIFFRRPVKGDVVLEFDPKRPGHFGFGIYESCAEYSNLTVYRPHWTDIGERKYVPGTKRAKAKRGR